MARDVPFTRRDHQIVVPLSIPPKFAVLLENAFDELSADSMSRHNHVKAIRLMLSDSLPHGGNAEYSVVITFGAKVSAERAQSLAREVSQWRRESLKVAMNQERGKSRQHHA